MTKPLNRRLLIVVAIVIGLLFCTLSFWNFQKVGKEKLQIGCIAASHPLFVAIEQGYFDDSGFNVELIQFGSSNEMALAGIQGDLNFCYENILSKRGCFLW